MSNRNISENLEYFVDNEGLHYTAPVIELVTTTFTLNGQPVVSGTVTAGTNINIGAAPTRVIDTYYPREVVSSLTGVNLVANTPLDIDWTAKTTALETFSHSPTPGAATTFIQLHAGTPQHWEFLHGGQWQTQLSIKPTVTVGNTHTLKMQILKSSDSGASFEDIQSVQVTKGGAGTPTVDHLGGYLCNQYITAAGEGGGERVKYTLTCTENKTVDLLLTWTLLGRN